MSICSRCYDQLQWLGCQYVELKRFALPLQYMAQLDHPRQQIPLPGPAEEPGIQKATDRFTTVDVNIFRATGSQLFEDLLILSKKVRRISTRVM